ncbi:DUF6491 family protein [Azomonas macrocytogenes]|uniref:Lipoprotein n=1 Tax=Azomonas macrocytogenes TaxID=69962 RepID=A0A839T1U9_AZOMA|nr:DUF6491 family protein [Azomonas macrocytogenes]MBB3102590.1 hypothetical protein [Azomonas macrocytogenes]
MSMRSYCFAAVVFFLGACHHSVLDDPAATLDEKLTALGFRQGEKVEQAWRYDFDGWQFLDNRHIVLGRWPSRSYLIEFSNECRMKSSSRIGYSTTVGNLSRFDQIFFSDTGNIPEFCRIGEIYRLEKANQPARN